MILLPAIDLKDGCCVRLQKGDFSTTHQVAADALLTAKAFVTAGARWVHMVDLDGARVGEAKNAEIVEQVASNTTLSVELGGGLRTMDDLKRADARGVARMVIGSAAVSDPDFVAQAVRQYGKRIAVGIDCLDGRVRVSGWEKDSGLDGIAFAKQMEALGVQHLIYTDIATDGMLSGPSFKQLEKLSQAVSCKITASGGVTTLDDIRSLMDLGLYGAIIGKAYYAGTLDLAAAMELAGPQND